MRKIDDFLSKLTSLFCLPHSFKVCVYDYLGKDELCAAGTEKYEYGASYNLFVIAKQDDNDEVMMISWR